MLNVRGMLCGIFGIFFVLCLTAVVWGQQVQQSDSALSQSQFMQIIDRIDKSEEKLRDHVDKKFGELDKKIDELNEDVAFINGQLTIIKWGIAWCASSCWSDNLLLAKP